MYTPPHRLLPDFLKFFIPKSEYKIGSHLGVLREERELCFRCWNQFSLVVRVHRKTRHCGDSPSAVSTAVTTWIALVATGSKRVGTGVMVGEEIAPEQN